MHAALENSSGRPDSRSEAGRERHMDAPVYVSIDLIDYVITMTPFHMYISLHIHAYILCIS